MTANKKNWTIFQTFSFVWMRTKLLIAAFLCEYLFEMKWLQIIKLARKLPTGDVSALKKANAVQDEEPLDENDLT